MLMLLLLLLLLLLDLFLNRVLDAVIVHAALEATECRGSHHVHGICAVMLLLWSTGRARACVYGWEGGVGEGC